MRSRFFRLVVVALTVSGAGAMSPVAATTNPCASTKAVNHLKKLARMETRALAANLVRVPGYCYVDISKSETNQIIYTLKKVERQAGAKVFAAVSGHSVVARDMTQNTARAHNNTKETGFLQLVAFTDAPPAGVDKRLATGTVGLPLAQTLDISGTKVFRFDNAQSRNSRYLYSWLREGVQGAIDGADRAPLEKWLRRYLAVPVLVGSETQTLFARLVAVPGFTYVDFDSSGLLKQYVTRPLGEVPSSGHQVADAKGAVGGIVLAQVGPGVSTQRFVIGLQQHGLAGFTDAGPVVLGNTTAEHLTWTDCEAYVWVFDGIAGVFLTAHRDRAAPFLAAFFA